jgi:hypothetical protein
MVTIAEEELKNGTSVGVKIGVRALASKVSSGFITPAQSKAAKLRLVALTGNGRKNCYFLLWG